MNKEIPKKNLHIQLDFSPLCCENKLLRRNNSICWKIKGMAMLEILPIILVMFTLMGATLGSWGLVHTAVLNSIAARNYSFFYFNNRSDLSYLRDMGAETGSYNRLSRAGQKFYRAQSNRFAFITSENHDSGSGKGSSQATLRFVDFKLPAANCQGDSNCLTQAEHNAIHGPTIHANQHNKKLVSPAWIMVGYGICLSAACE